MTWVNSLGHVLFPFARWQHDHAQTPLPCKTSMTRAWAVATACPPWGGLTVCVYMDVHASGSRSLLCASCYTLFYLLMPAARLVSVNDRHHIFGPHSQTFCCPARTP